MMHAFVFCSDISYVPLFQ